MVLFKGKDFDELLALKVQGGKEFKGRKLKKDTRV